MHGYLTDSGKGLGECPVFWMRWKKETGWMLAEVEKERTNDEIKLLHLLHHPLG